MAAQTPPGPPALITSQVARKVRDPVFTGDKQISCTLSSTGTYTFELTIPSDYFTLQSSGTLTYTWAVSANGTTYGSSSSTIAAGAFSTYTGPDVIANIQITWVSGSGQVTILAL